MREIEFRMWSGKAKKYFYDDEESECLSQQIRHDTKRARTGVPYDHIKDGRVFEQYTGLLDKNGKKIFDGDRVLIKNDPSFMQKKEIEGTVKMCTYGAWFVSVQAVLKWVKYRVAPPALGKKMYFLNIYDTHIIEIIGTIHE